MSEDSKLVYSSEFPGQNLKKKKSKKEDVQEFNPEDVTLKLRIEKKGRGGKAVTIIYDLPQNPPYFKKLLKEIKNFCGTGGSQKKDLLEIQGDQRPKIKEFLLKKNFKVKG